MNIIQCKLCRKPFQSVGNKICGNCLQEIDDAFIVIRDYLSENPGNMTLEKLAEETEVQKDYILHLIREGRLEINSPKTGGLLACSVCHKPIQEGTMCIDCRSNLSSTLSGALPKPAEPEKKTSSKDRARPKMHIDHSNR